MQAVLTTLIVLAASLYAAWVLLPAAARRALAVRLLRWPPAARLGPLTTAWQRAARAAPAGSCACDGCDQGAAARPAAGQPVPIRIHRRPPR